MQTIVLLKNIKHKIFIDSQNTLNKELICNNFIVYGIATKIKLTEMNNSNIETKQTILLFM